MTQAKTYPDLLNKKFGFSLLEIAISMVVFGIILISLSLPLYTSAFLLNNNNNLIQASTLAKAYFKNLENHWNNELSYNQGNLINIDTNYTKNDHFKITREIKILSTDDEGNTLIKRVILTYKDNNDNFLMNAYYDYVKPGISTK